MSSTMEQLVEAFVHDPATRWMRDAICAQTDPESFFPELGGSTKDPKRVCAVCPVKSECLQYALDTDQRFGVWGGTSEVERRRMRRERKGAAA